MADSVKFALIGLGRFGQKRLRAFLRNRSIAELIYVCDIDQELCRRTAKEVDATPISFDELLHKRDYDVAMVCVPNVWHYEIVNGLLEHGKDVWCEKPLSVNSSLAKKLLIKSIKKRRYLKVGSNVRFFPNVLRAREFLERNDMGAILISRGWIGNAGSHLSGGSWYTKKELIGGGTLLDNGVHLIDLNRWLIGEITECVSCYTTQLRHSFVGLEDNAIAIYRSEGNSLITIHSSWTDTTGYMYLDIVTSNEYLVLDSRFSKMLLKTPRGEEDLTSIGKESYDLELDDFVSKYNAGLYPSPTAYDGYRSVKIVELSYRAAESHSKVSTFDEEDANLRSLFEKEYKNL